VASKPGAELPDVAISLSDEIGRIGLLERENATVINAALRELAAHIVDGLAASVTGAGITAPLYLSQNDGTLMDIDVARRYPVATFERRTGIVPTPAARSNMDLGNASTRKLSPRKAPSCRVERPAGGSSAQITTGPRLLPAPTCGLETASRSTCSVCGAVG
jgi:hypothetical protein